jgi:hypothetical protein
MPPREKQSCEEHQRRRHEHEREWKVTPPRRLDCALDRGSRSFLQFSRVRRHPRLRRGAHRRSVMQKTPCRHPGGLCRANAIQHRGRGMLQSRQLTCDAGPSTFGHDGSFARCRDFRMSAAALAQRDRQACRRCSFQSRCGCHQGRPRGLRSGADRHGRNLGRNRLRRQRGLLDRRRLERRPRQRTNRQEAERVDIAMLIAREADAEVDERLLEIDLAARADRPDHRALPDDRAAGHTDRAQVQERHRVAERGLDGDGLAAGRHGARERYGAVSRRENRCAGRSAEIDAAMLTARVGMGAIERKRPEHRAVDRPGPRLRNRRRQRECKHNQDHDSPHDSSSLLPDLRTEENVAELLSVVNTGYKVRR